MKDRGRKIEGERGGKKYRDRRRGRGRERVRFKNTEKTEKSDEEMRK